MRKGSELTSQGEHADHGEERIFAGCPADRSLVLIHWTYLLRVTSSSFCFGLPMLVLLRLSEMIDFHRNGFMRPTRSFAGSLRVIRLFFRSSVGCSGVNSHRLRD